MSQHAQSGDWFALRTGDLAEDVANVVGFLASGKSSYMTGQAINVTGGLVMH
jgi:NAD(P)-dependent dehydrogenase (short-subunit alcohol dehydrogenase family)